MSEVATQKSTEVYDSVRHTVSNYSKSGWSNLSAMWNQQSNYQQPCEQSNLIYTSGGGLSTQNSDDWTSGWDTWGQDNHSTESKTKKSSKGDQKSKLIDFGAETEEKSKKSALSDAWDNDGWETLNKDD